MCNYKQSIHGPRCFSTFWTRFLEAGLLVKVSAQIWGWWLFVPACPPKRPHQSVFPSAVHEGDRPNSMRTGMQVPGLCTALGRAGTQSGNSQRHQHRKRTSCQQWGKDRGDGSCFSQRDQKWWHGAASVGAPHRGPSVFPKCCHWEGRAARRLHRAVITTWPRNAVPELPLLLPTSCVTLGNDLSPLWASVFPSELTFLILWSQNQS